jgi:hypothetical protein
MMDETVAAEQLIVSKGSSKYRITLIWYLIGVSVVFWLVALGVTSETPSPYYNETDTTPWWSPVNLFFSAIFALMIPLPHTLIATAFRSKRNWDSVLAIFRGWYKFTLGLFLIGMVVGLFTSRTHAQLSNLEYELPQSTQVDGFRLVFACGNLVKRLAGDSAGSAIHGFAVSRMVGKVPTETGHQLIKEAGAFTTYVSDFYGGNTPAIAQAKTELCSQAQVFFSDLPKTGG